MVGCQFRLLYCRNEEWSGIPRPHTRRIATLILRLDLRDVRRLPVQLSETHTKWTTVVLWCPLRVVLRFRPFTASRQPHPGHETLQH
jgi:hypothetical protein